VWAAYACFACRIFIPMGYMPAPLSAGGPVVLCDGGFDGALLKHVHGAHQHHHDHGSAAHDHSGGSDDGSHSTHDAWKHCPVGVLFGTAALATTFSLPLLDLSFERPTLPVYAAPRVAVTVPYRSRAPPASLPV
jgi:Protein of unknown function (DUF2946)